MRVIETNEPIVLKGSYLVTDPCYVYDTNDVKDHKWDDFCNLLVANEERVSGVSEKTIPFPDYDSIKQMEDPKETIKALFALDKEYEAKRREAQLKLSVSRRSIITTFEIAGKIVHVMSTAYGDGSYPVFDPKTGKRVGGFGVDAGLFAFIPAETLPEGMRGDLGTIVNVDGVLTCKDGDAFIDGKLVVDTSGQSEDDN